MVCNGVPEFQPFSMEVQTVGRLAIKGIAYDGAVHTVGMSGMDAQLVGAACFGVVGDAGSLCIQTCRMFPRSFASLWMTKK